MLINTRTINQFQKNNWPEARCLTAANTCFENVIRVTKLESSDMHIYTFHASEHPRIKTIEMSPQSYNI